MNESEIANALASNDKELVKDAVDEIMQCGERLMPPLTGHKGNNRCFADNRKLGHRGSGTMTFSPHDDAICAKDPKAVTVEVAALFLISAIYYDDLEFAAPPRLCDRAEDSDKSDHRCLESGNTPERVEKAWTAVEQWINCLNSQKLESLRANNHNPLATSTVTFY